MVQIARSRTSTHAFLPPSHTSHESPRAKPRTPHTCRPGGPQRTKFPHEPHGCGNPQGSRVSEPGHGPALLQCHCAWHALAAAPPQPHIHAHTHTHTHTPPRPTAANRRRRRRRRCAVCANSTPPVSRVCMNVRLNPEQINTVADPVCLRCTLCRGLLCTVVSPCVLTRTHVSTHTCTRTRTRTHTHTHAHTRAHAHAHAHARARTHAHIATHIAAATQSHADGGPAVGPALGRARRRHLHLRRQLPGVRGRAENDVGQAHRAGRG